MRLRLTNLHIAPNMGVDCCKCEARIGAGKTKVYIDLDGKAFKSYYCQECASRTASCRMCLGPVDLARIIDAQSKGLPAFCSDECVMAKYMG